MARTLPRSPKRKRLESRDRVVMTSFALPRDLHHHVAMAALTLNWSFAEVTRQALREWLDRHGHGRAAAHR